MFVVKRDGRKSRWRIRQSHCPHSETCLQFRRECGNVSVAQKVIEGIFDGVTTSQLDTWLLKFAASMTTKHPDYAVLAARIAVSNLHKNTKKSVQRERWKTCMNTSIRKQANSISYADDVFGIMWENRDMLDSTIIYDRDFGLWLFWIKRWRNHYLLKIDGKVAERPQHMIMRVAVGIHKNDLDLSLKLTTWWVSAGLRTQLYSLQCRNTKATAFILFLIADAGRQHWRNLYTLKNCAKISTSARRYWS